MTSLRVPLAAMVAVAPIASTVLAAPTTTGFESMRSAAGAREVKIWSRGGTYSFERAQFDSTGIWSMDPSVYRPSRQAVFQTAGARDSIVPRPIAWSQVDSVAVLQQRGMSEATRGALFLICMGVAFTAGIVAGYSAYAGTPYILPVVLAPVAAGVGFGLAFGGGKPDVEVVYRAMP